MYSAQRKACQSGLTLVELMIATAVAAVLMIVTFSLYQVVNGSFDDTQRHQFGLDPAVRGLDVLSRDLRCTVIPPEVSSVFELIPPEEEDESAELRFYTSIPKEEGEGLDDAEIYEVRYLVTDRGLERRLLKDEEAVRGDVVSPVVVRMIVEAGNSSDNLVGIWPPNPDLKGPPPLIHIVLFYPDPQGVELEALDTHVAIPAAISIDPQTAAEEPEDDEPVTDEPVTPPLR